jgi:hypothetical protein
MSKPALPKLIAIGAATMFVLGAVTFRPVVVNAQSAITTPPGTSIVGDDLKRLETRASNYYGAAFSNDPATFYASVAPDYVGIGRDGEKLSAGTVLGKIQGLKLLDDRGLNAVSVISATRSGGVITATVLINASADVVEPDGLFTLTSTYPHTLTLAPTRNGGLLVVRDVGASF